MSDKPLRRIAKLPPPAVEQWIAYLSKALRIRRLTNYGGQDLFVKTAARIAIFGEVGDPHALEVYQQIVPFLFAYHRIQQWGSVLNLMPADTKGMIQLTKSIQAAGQLEPVERAKFGPQTFITVAAQLPDPRAYVEVCKRESHRLIRSAFHPNTLSYVRDRYKGVVGSLADPTYGDDVAAHIKTVS